MPQDFSTGQVLTAAQMDTLSGAVDGYATTATAAGTTTLTTASMYQQFFTGSTTQTVTMPVASTLYLGQKFRIVNNSSGVVTAQSSGANTIYAIPAGGDVIFTCILASGTTAASWNYKNYISAGGGGGKVLQVVTVQYSTSTTIATTTFTDTGLSATITPTLNTSKILVLISQSGQSSRSGARCWGGWQYLRGATVLASGGIVFGIDVTGGTATEYAAILSACYLDSPATTSATTYKTQAKAYESTSSGQVAMNGFASTITLMEIGA